MPPTRTRQRHFNDAVQYVLPATVSGLSNNFPTDIPNSQINLDPGTYEITSYGVGAAAYSVAPTFVSGSFSVLDANNNVLLGGTTVPFGNANAASTFRALFYTQTVLSFSSSITIRLQCLVNASGGTVTNRLFGGIFLIARRIG